MIYPITPVPKPRMTQRDKWRKRPSVLRYRRFKDQVRLRRLRLPQPCSVVFWMPMPGSWSDAKRLEMHGQPHTVRPDLDNLLKALCDAVHQEDAHLHDIRAQKRWGSGSGAIEVRAQPEECIDCGSTLHRTGTYHCPAVHQGDSAD